MIPAPRALERLLASWRANPEIAENIAAWYSVPGIQADLAPFPANLHPALKGALEAGGIRALYSHQLETWESVQQGENVAVVTGTASGKTLCYNLPVLDRLARDSSARALYLFPTKALAQDQQKALEILISAMGQAAAGALPPVRAAAYDGDTPSAHRPTIRSASRLVITNPDMLHTGVLPHH
ncbi:MAG TPA: DEAD/DEAH box helicase, partial [Anaerolineaceae bacterium]